MLTPHGPHSFEVTCPVTISHAGIHVPTADLIELLGEQLRAGETERHYPRVRLTFEVLEDE